MSEPWRDIPLADVIEFEAVATACEWRQLLTVGAFIDALNECGHDSMAEGLTRFGASREDIDTDIANVRRARDTKPVLHDQLKGKKEMAKTSRPSAQKLDVGVKFGTWSGLGETASISFTIAEGRERCSKNYMEQMRKMVYFLVSARFKCEVRLGNASQRDAEGQQEFSGMKTVAFKAGADSRSLSVKDSGYSGRLSFKTAAIPVSKMHQLVNQPGRIICTEREDLVSGNEVEDPDQMTLEETE